MHMNRFAFLFLVAVPFTLRSQSVEAPEPTAECYCIQECAPCVEEPPPPPPPPPPPAPKPICCLKGILLLPCDTEINPEGYENIVGIQIHDVDIPGSVDDFKNWLKEDYVGHVLTKEKIDAIKKGIASYYRRHHRPLVTVIAPQQDITGCVLQLIIIEGKVGQIEVCGNTHFSSERLCNYLRVMPGDCLRSDKINEDLVWMNKNPFRQVSLVYKPGDCLGTTDIQMLVQDRRTYRFYGGIDNTGNDYTGNNRLFAGFNSGNVFNTDHLLSFQFTANQNFNRFKAYTLHYTVPLPWRHTLTMYGGYSTVESKFDITDIVGGKFRNSGFSGQASFRYDMPFRPIYSFLQEFSWGFDWKRTNNSLEFGALPVFSKNVNLTQLMASYNIGYQTNNLTTSFEVEGFASPLRWLPDQSNADYQSLRLYSKYKYFYARSSFALTYHFHRWFYYNIYMRGQAATRNLLPSEEYGVGGYDTVRGYKEREVNGDSAFVANFELTHSPVALSRMFGIESAIDSLQLLAFLDYGAAFIHQAAPGQKKNYHLYSGGPGLRYKIGPWVSVRTDWGFQLHPVAGGPRQRLHFQAIASY